MDVRFTLRKMQKRRANGNVEDRSMCCHGYVL